MPLGTEFPTTRSHRSRRAILAAGGAALLGCASFGLLSLGVASAQQGPPPEMFLSAGPADAGYVKFDSTQIKEQHAKFVSTLASKLGVTADKLQQALKETEQEVGPVPLPLGAGTPMVGGQTLAISVASDLAPAATALGISEDQLRQQLAGKSLTDVAKAQTVDPAKVAAAIKTARLADLDRASQAGKLPAEFASRVKSGLDEEIAMLMTTVRSATGALGEMHRVRIELNPPAE